MTDQPQPAAMLELAMTAIKARRPAEAQRLLRDLLAADPRNEQGWLWMSAVVASPDAKIRCLQQVLVINPENAAARRGLEALGAPPEPPPALALEPEPEPEPAPELEPAADAGAIGFDSDFEADWLSDTVLATPRNDAPEPAEAVEAEPEAGLFDFGDEEGSAWLSETIAAPSRPEEPAAEPAPEAGPDGDAEPGILSFERDAAPKWAEEPAVAGPRAEAAASPTVAAATRQARKHGRRRSGLEKFLWLLLFIIAVAICVTAAYLVVTFNLANSLGF